MSKMEVQYLDHSGSDLLVINAARVSFSKESKELSDKDKKLIEFLAREKHLLPFRHPTATFRCKAPLFVARQLGKHQVGMSWSEESRRYIKTGPEFYWPQKWRKAAENVKQGSSDEEISVLNIFENICSGVDVDVREYVAVGLGLYNKFLERGVAPEQARMILPQNLMITWVWTGTLLAWVHLIKERTASTAQRETQEFANLVAKEIERLYPCSYRALVEC